MPRHSRNARSTSRRNIRQTRSARVTGLTGVARDHSRLLAYLSAAVVLTGAGAATVAAGAVSGNAARTVVVGDQATGPRAGTWSASGGARSGALAGPSRTPGTGTTGRSGHTGSRSAGQSGSVPVSEPRASKRGTSGRQPGRTAARPGTTRAAATTRAHSTRPAHQSGASHKPSSVHRASSLHPASSGHPASPARKGKAQRARPAHHSRTWKQLRDRLARQTYPQAPAHKLPLYDRLIPGTPSGPQASMPMTASRMANATTIVRVALDRHMGLRSAVVAVATAMQESTLENIDYGDRDSLGLFQQRPSTGWGTPREVTTPTYAAGAFLTALRGHQEADPAWAAQPLWVLAQGVQESGFPYAYAKWETQAAQVVAQIVRRQY